MSPVVDRILPALERLRPLVDGHVTTERVRRYLRAIAELPAPSTAASALRTPLLRRLLAEDGALDEADLHLHHDLAGTCSTAILTGSSEPAKPLWYLAHLDTLSYLVQPRQGGRYPLVPFGYHLIGSGRRPARTYRFDLALERYRVTADGELVSEEGRPFFLPDDPGIEIEAGDRVVLHVPYREDEATGTFTGHVDNAGAVAALAVAAPVLARAGIEALLAFPDEEEGPQSAGSQSMGRGGSRIVGLLPAPELAIVADVQQAGGGPDAHTEGGIENTTRLGDGAVLAEFSSLARGAVTPPHLYALARATIGPLARLGVRVQASNNAYTSRSDDVSVLLKTPNILLLGFPGFNRHFDRGEPRANLNDVIDLAKAAVYYAALRPLLRELQQRLAEAAA